MLNIVIFGPPGAGKGTQAKNIIEKYQLVHFSTGDIIRAEIKSGSDLGKEAKAIAESGQLLSDEIVNNMVEHKIGVNKDANGFIFDGFPRTIPQAEALEKMLANHNMKIDHVVLLDVEKSELVERLLKRAQEQNRPDDTEEVIKKRLEVYEAETLPVAEFYEKQSKLSKINGIGEIDDVFDRISKILG